MKIHVRDEKSLEITKHNAYYDPFGTLVVDFKAANGKILVIELFEANKIFKLTRTTTNIKTGEETKEDLTYRWEYVNTPTTRIFNRFKEKLTGWFEQIKKELED